ncbi:hypothetical protein AHF37_09010 [Paragonimus kellicotti]|nr:hypothetical protein AHF37_09010 [Paragonimus kellicotti]
MYRSTCNLSHDPLNRGDEENTANKGISMSFIQRSTILSAKPMHRLVDFSHCLIFSQKLNVKPQDVKLFLIGMCIVLVAEILLDITHTSSICSVNDSGNLKPQPSYFGTVDMSYAKKLASTIHIYCFILTEPSQFASQHHVQNTWVRRCTRYGFVSPGSDSLLRLLGEFFWCCVCV